MKGWMCTVLLVLGCDEQATIGEGEDGQVDGSLIEEGGVTLLDAGLDATLPEAAPPDAAQLEAALPEATPPDAAPPAPDAWVPWGDGLVVSEVVWEGEGPNWIELLNVGVQPIALEGHLLSERRFSGFSIRLHTDRVLMPGEQVLVPRREGHCQDDLRDLHHHFRLGQASEVHLFAPDGTPIDALRWTEADIGVGQTFGRCGGGAEVGRLREPTPGARNTDCAEPGPAVIISELMVDPAGDRTRIELHNVGRVPLLVDDFSLRGGEGESQTPQRIPPGAPIEPGGRRIVEVEGALMRPSLLDARQRLLSVLALPNRTWPFLPDRTHLSSEAPRSLGRCSDGDRLDFMPETLGAPNAPCATDLRINEVRWAPNQEHLVVELKNTGEGPLERAGYRLHATSFYPYIFEDEVVEALGPGAPVAPGGLVVAASIPRIGGPSGQSPGFVLTLLGPFTEVTDRVVVTPTDLGIGDAWGVCGDEPTRLGRMQPTEGRPNGACLAEEPPSPVVISEVVHSRLRGHDAIELYNRTDEAIDLGGWAVWDEEHNGGPDDEDLPLVLPAGTRIAPGGLLLLPQAPNLVPGFGLGEDDGVRLYAPSGRAVDGVSWSEHDERVMSMGRPRAGEGEPVRLKFPTPGAPNATALSCMDLPLLDLNAHPEGDGFRMTAPLGAARDEPGFCGGSREAVGVQLVVPADGWWDFGEAQLCNLPEEQCHYGPVPLSAGQVVILVVDRSPDPDTFTVTARRAVPIEVGQPCSRDRTVCDDGLHCQDPIGRGATCIPVCRP